MSDLAGALQKYKLIELQKSDAALDLKLAAILPPQPIPLDDITLRRLEPFYAYCKDRGVLVAPARPQTVAAYIFAQLTKGERPDRIFELTAAIELLHDHHGLANPVATAIARGALASLGAIEAPRSWRAPEKNMFPVLPVEIQSAIARREQEREKEIRRMQNATAEKLRQSDGAETKPVEVIKEKTNDNQETARQ